MTPQIRIYTTSWCPDCHSARKFLEGRRLAYEEIDIDANPKAAEFVTQANNGKRKVPTFVFDGRIFHCSPYDAEKLARELGLQAASQSAFWNTHTTLKMRRPAMPPEPPHPQEAL
jgi:mycoredoxin